MFGPRHERWVEELNVQLQYKESITSSGAVMVLPSATADLRDWLTDGRKYVWRQYEDWMQVVRDWRASVKQTGPKLGTLVKSTAEDVDSLLTNLFLPNDPGPVASPIATCLRTFLPANAVHQMASPIDRVLRRLAPRVEATEKLTYKIDPDIRAEVLRHVERLDEELTSEEAIVVAWRDLVAYTKNVKRTVDEVAFCRDTLYAIAQRRNLDVVGDFALFGELSSLVSDVANAVHEQIQMESGGDFEPCNYQPGTPSGVPMKRRLALCDRLLRRHPERGDCIVWLKIASASLPQLEVSHGQMTFYNGVHLSGLVGSAERADRFEVPPNEVLTLDQDEGPILRAGEVLWENGPNIVYARVVLPDIEIHAADAMARVLVKGLIAVNHAMEHTWQVHAGSILFVDGECRTLISPWGATGDPPPMFYAQNDRMGWDVQVMSLNNQSLNSQSVHDLRDAIAMSTALKMATAESPQATVMAAVRAIEHVNSWTTRGVDNWADFARHHFKKAQSQGELVRLLGAFAVIALNSRSDLRGDVAAQQEVFDIEAEMKQPVMFHDNRYDRRVAAEKLEALHRIYLDHWLSRALRELSTALSTGQYMHKRLEENGRQFDLKLTRLKRLRNAAIHGGPVSDAACESVAGFAAGLGHRCLNEAMKALLIGREIDSHMTEYLADSRARYELARTTGDIENLFAPGGVEPGDS